MTSWDPSQDAWLAGFVDGEASFNITDLPRSGADGARRRRLQPRFDLHLRADDAPILRTLREAFGGSTRLARRSVGHATYDRFTWCVAAKADLRGLVAYFDRFPLRSKKAADYAIWREAVLLYVEAPSGPEVANELAALREALIDGRRYVSAPARSVLEGAAREG